MFFTGLAGSHTKRFSAQASPFANRFAPTPSGQKPARRGSNRATQLTDRSSSSGHNGGPAAHRYRTP
ncbi:hypothetical protein B1F73_21165 [Pseudomonas syringae]|nr:hypothetical protein B1F71_11795 [Pseudomonas syringae]RXT80143.1 hypothetical protein B1F77_01675 [Pseudomonas syringae]RXT82819.1 hypothetical protein B1F72_24830 [Pseudomonas syringae]RXT96018.1 hypothetical protein B1F75_08490 [Pseudomonas syringae]RXT96153.1 hypothetical protein B1F73_21165 [Pseudomonas syringae]